jgi:hypothetical protein
MYLSFLLYWSYQSLLSYPACSLSVLSVFYLSYLLSSVILAILFPSYLCRFILDIYLFFYSVSILFLVFIYPLYMLSLSLWCFSFVSYLSYLSFLSFLSYLSVLGIYPLFPICRFWHVYPFFLSALFFIFVPLILSRLTYPFYLSISPAVYLTLPQSTCIYLRICLSHDLFIPYFLVTHIYIYIVYIYTYIFFSIHLAIQPWQLSAGPTPTCLPLQDRNGTERRITTEFALKIRSFRLQERIPPRVLSLPAVIKG